MRFRDGSGPACRGARTGAACAASPLTSGCSRARPRRRAARRAARTRGRRSAGSALVARELARVGGDGEDPAAEFVATREVDRGVDGEQPGRCRGRGRADDHPRAQHVAPLRCKMDGAVGEVDDDPLRGVLEIDAIGADPALRARRHALEQHLDVARPVDDAGVEHEQDVRAAPPRRTGADDLQGPAASRANARGGRLQDAGRVGRAGGRARARGNCAAGSGVGAGVGVATGGSGDCAAAGAAAMPPASASTTTEAARRRPPRVTASCGLSP